MDLNRLSNGEKIAAGSGIALFVFMFFSWFSVGEGGFSATADAWSSLTWIRWILLLAVIAAVAFPLLKASGNEIEIPIPPATVITVLGGLAFLLVLYRIIDPPGFGVAGISLADAGVDVSRGIGVFLGLIAAAGITFGGFTAMQEEGTTFQDALDNFSSTRDSGGQGPGAGPGPGADQGPGAGQGPGAAQGGSASPPPPPPPPPSAG